ncbi:MAG: WD40 repeat domain-containing protein, partial [Deltaproteobacteria bacterium]|nr:WD40 repeat domain-containing protein [Deltaproteobacteria bacterium]
GGAGGGGGVGGGGGPAEVGLGVDFLAIADEGGRYVVPLGGGGEVGQPVALPAEAGSSGPMGIEAVCDGAAAIEYPGGVEVLRRTASGWRSESIDGKAWGEACTAGGTVVALVRNQGFEVRSAAGVAAVASGASLAGAMLVDGGAGVDLLRGDGPSGTTRVSFDLQEFTVSSARVEATVAELDPATGAVLWSGEDGLRLETPAGSSVFEAAGGWRPVALRSGVAASIGPSGDRVALLDGTGVVLGEWRRPGWLEVSSLAPGVDGRTVVGSGPQGFVVWRTGREEPVLYFEGEGYAGAPAEVSPDGGSVLIGRDDGMLETWSLESWEVERSFFAINEQGGRPTVIRWSADGETLFVGGARGGVVALHGRTGNALWGDVLHDGPVTVLEPGTAGPWVLSADARTAVLTAARGGERLIRLALGVDGSWAAFTVDGYHVTGGASGTELLALRVPLPGGEPGKQDWTLVGADDPDFGTLGGAVDALRVTLLGAASSGEEE